MSKGLLTPRRLLVIVLAVLAVGIIVTVKESKASMAADGSYRRASNDTINIAIAYSPMSLYRYGDTLGGFNYEMMKEIAAAYGDNVRFHPVSSVQESLDKLESGDYDMLMADIPATASMKERFRFSVPVYTDRLVLVSRDTILTSPLQLADEEVWVVKGSPAAERLYNLSREIGDSIPVHESTYYNAEQLVMLVSAGDIPAAVVNKEVALRLKGDCPDAHISTHISLSQFQSWIFRKDETALADTIDAQIERFKKLPEYTELLEKWTE